MSGTTTSQAAMIACNHFGLGAYAGAAMPDDPAGWLLAQLRGPDTTSSAGLPSTADALALVHNFMTAGAGSTAGADYGNQINALFTKETNTFLGHALTTRQPFRERLVWFWMNHLPIQAATIPTISTAGAYVREAIRPNVTGNFSDLLIAAVLHPSMLYSLSNDASIGPDSQIGQNILRNTGVTVTVNENLGRETLELFTVGVNGGYTQADVDGLANLLTGCNVNGSTAPQGFVYNPKCAEPGSQTVMGNSYPNTFAGITAALTWLGTHPLTYQHLATKLVTHFTSDTPTVQDIAAVAHALSVSGGNLAAAAAAVVRLPNAWIPLTKLRTPIDYVVATLRALGATPATFPDIYDVLFAMGQPLWSPPFPNGWSDLAADWVSPEGTLIRGDWANTLIASLPNATADAFVAAGIGPLLTTNTIQGVNAATSTHDQLTLLLTSPEFQRR